MKVCFETFGCRLNKAEALQMEATYLAAGWKVTASHSDADLIVVRGCSVTSRAQDECMRLIRHLQRHYPKIPVKICGCLPQPKAVSPQLAILAPHPPPGAAPAVSTRTARAYLKVQDGCSGKCAFCIVPQFRGKSKSEDFTSVLDGARRFIDAGYHEIVVTGCNLTHYASQGKGLPELLSALAELDGGCRIRLGSVEPGACAKETVRAMAEHKNVCRFLHLPIQSGSNAILKSMRRPYLVKDVEEAAHLAQTLMPSIGLGCDLMTGFPGEADIDFIATKGLLRRLPFSNAHVFPYSNRPGTSASRFSSQVLRYRRVLRARELNEIIRKKRHEFASDFVGKTVDVIVESERSGRGWTGEYMPCKITGNVAPRKSSVRVFVMKTEGDLLRGRAVV